MSQQQIALEPEIVHFGSDNKQLIKISNKTGQIITNCFFCLFNTSKYQFSPQSFKLQPWQHKIITISLIGKSANYNGKEFAYIKSKNFSKRITLCISSNQSDEKMRSPSSGRQQINTLTSRDYRDAQKNAFDRVIAEKQAYIKRLQRRLQQQQQSSRKDRSFTSDGKNRNNYLKQIEELELKILEYRKQKQTIINENSQLKVKIKELQQSFIKKTIAKQSIESNQIQKIIQNKQQLISKLKQDIYYLQQQCQSLYGTISQKQQKIKKYQKSKNEMIEQIIKENERKVRQLQIKMQQQRKKNKEKVKKLQDKISQNQVVRNRRGQIQQQMQKKQNELNRLQIKFDEQKKKKKQLQEQKKRSLKVQLHNQSLIQENNMLKSKVQNLQRSIEDLKEQTIIYRSKVQQGNFDKASRYLQVALQSCKNQNQLLKRSRKQLQYTLAQQSKSRKNYESKYLQLEQKIKNLKQQIQQLQNQKQDLISKSRLTYNQSHQTIMKLRSQNIDLIEKINFAPKNQQVLQKQLKQSRLKLQKSEQQIKKSKIQAEKNLLKLKQIEQQKQKMTKKVQRYKKQTTRQLKSISQSTIDELKRLKQQKKALLQKVKKLEEQIRERDEKQKQKQKANIDSTMQNIKYENKNDKYEAKTRYPASQSERRTGIKNQRKGVQQSSSFIRNQQVQHMYCQLGQLRQFKNYINLQVKKMKTVLFNAGTQSKQQNSDSNGLIYTCVNIFENLRGRINQQNYNRQKIAETQKQLAFLKGRINQLENVSKYVKNNDISQEKLSAIQFNKYGIQDKNLLQLVRSQMKSQYKKLYDSLQISNQRFEQLKKKIYQQYRSRIIGLLNSKQKLDNASKILKIEAVLQRFVDGLANKSHREAILAKQVRLKQQARKQAGTLKQKVGYLNQLLQTKKGYCSRDPIKYYGCMNQPEWHDNIRLQARLLTYQAENARLLEQINFHQTQSKSFQQQLKLSLDELELKQQQIIRLKKQVIAIQAQNAKELIKRQQNIQELQKNFFSLKDEQKSSDNQKRRSMDKQYAQMRQQIQRKKQIIKNLKQKQKMLEQLIQSSNRSQQSNRNKNKKQIMQQLRVQQSLRQFKENNRQLRSENTRLKQQITSLQSQLQKKNLAIKRFKGQGQQYRIKSVKQESEQNQKLRSQLRQQKDQIKILKSESQKYKKKKDKQIMELDSQIRRLKNEYIIQKSSLQSVIRALSDNFRRIHSDLCIMAKKKGKSIEFEVDFQDLLTKPGQIDAIKVYQSFQQVLKALKS